MEDASGGGNSSPPIGGLFAEVSTTQPLPLSATPIPSVSMVVPSSPGIMTSKKSGGDSVAGQPPAISEATATTRKRKYDAVAQTRASRRREKILRACEAVRTAEFVAVDLEFTGLFDLAKKSKTIEDHYYQCRDNVPHFMAVQFGICTVHRDENEKNSWILTPFNFHLFPSKRKVFKSDSTSLSWLLQQGFDFKEWIEDGYDYTQLAFVTGVYEGLNTTDLRITGVQSIMETIVEWQRPCVVHNGLLDLCHIYEKFLGPMPLELDEFCKNCVEYFQGGLYDTKHIAETGRIRIFQLSDQSRGATSLDTLRFHLAHRKSNLTFRLNDQFQHLQSLEGYHLWVPFSNHANIRCFPAFGGASIAGNILAEKSPPASAPAPTTLEATETTESEPTENELALTRKHTTPDKSHEAGYDALVTAQVFLLELEWCRKAGDATDQILQDPQSLIPRDWHNLSTISQCRNCVPVMGVSPGCFYFSEPHVRTGGTGPVSHKTYRHPVSATARQQLAAPPHPALPPILQQAAASSPGVIPVSSATGGPPPNKLVAVSTHGASRSPAIPRRGSRGLFMNLKAVFTDEPLAPATTAPVPVTSSGSSSTPSGPSTSTQLSQQPQQQQQQQVRATTSFARHYHPDYDTHGPDHPSEQIQSQDSFQLQPQLPLVSALPPSHLLASFAAALASPTDTVMPTLPAEGEGFFPRPSYPLTPGPTGLTAVDRAAGEESVLSVGDGSSDDVAVLSSSPLPPASAQQQYHSTKSRQKEGKRSKKSLASKNRSVSGSCADAVDDSTKSPML